MRKIKDFENNTLKAKRVEKKFETTIKMMQIHQKYNFCILKIFRKIKG